MPHRAAEYRGVKIARRYIRTWLLGIAFAVALASCSSGPAETIPFAESAPAPLADPDPVVVPDEQGVVDVVGAGDVIAFQADWMCELQRRNFTDLAAADTALLEALADTGLSRPDYDEFLMDMADSQELRDEVLSLFQQRCRA